jgi:hypothetical protein
MINKIVFKKSILFRDKKDRDISNISIIYIKNQQNELRFLTNQWGKRLIGGAGLT